MRNLKIILGLLITGSLVILATMVVRTVAPPKGETSPPPEASHSADLKLDRVHYIETQDGVKQWELEAASAVYFKDHNTVLLNKVKATFFAKDQETYVLTAGKGRLDTQTKIIEGFDGVNLVSSSGYHLRTRSLSYRPEKKEIHTAEPVSLEGPHVRVNGVGLVVEIDHRRMKILNQVETILDPMLAGKLPRSKM